MKLYYSPGACSLAPHIVLEELGLPYETEKVDLKAKLTASGQDFLAVNPKGYVPALLLENGELLTEGPAIMQYLADQAPAKQLAPANGSLERYRLQSWLTFIGTELHRNFSPFFNPAATDEWKRVALAALQRRFTYVNDQLAGRDYLLDSGYSVADVYLFVVLGWGKYIQLDVSGWAHLQAWQARVGARPAVRATLQAEGLA